MTKLYLDSARTMLSSCDSPYALDAPYAPSPNLAVRDLLAPLYTLVGVSGDAVQEHDLVLFGSPEEACFALLFSSYLFITRKTGKNHLCLAQSSETPLVEATRSLTALGIHTSIAPINKNGVITVDAVAEALTPRTALVSIPWGCGLSGVIHPIEEIAALCKERGVLLHVDATHVVGKGDFTLQESGADFFTLRATPFAAVAMTALFISPQAPMTVVTRPSFDIGMLARFSEAARSAVRDLYTISTEVSYQRTTFEERVCTLIPETWLPFREAPRLPHIAAIAFPKVHSEALAFHLMRKGIIAARGEGIFQSLSELFTAVSQEPNTLLSFCFTKDIAPQRIEEALIHLKTAYTLLKEGALP